MFTAYTVSSMDICLAEEKLYSEDSLVCSAASYIGSTLVGLVESSK